jgi:hypothetical protein
MRSIECTRSASPPTLAGCSERGGEIGKNAGAPVHGLAKVCRIKLLPSRLRLAFKMKPAHGGTLSQNVRPLVDCFLFRSGRLRATHLPGSSAALGGEQERDREDSL